MGSGSESSYGQNGGSNSQMNAGTIIDVEPNPEQPDSDIDEQTPSDKRRGGSSTENDDVPY